MVRALNFTETNVHWGYWAAGFYGTLLTLGATSVESDVYGGTAVILFLFLWGFLRSEQD